MKTIWFIVALLIGFIPNANSNNISHPAPFGDDSQLVVYELLGRGCFWIDMKIIKLVNSRRVTMVDDEDFEMLSKYRWHLQPEREYVRSIYRKVGRKIYQVFMHRLIAKTPKSKLTDHIDGNKLNNQKSNLRIATNAENIANSKKSKTRKGKPTSSRFKGVTWHKLHHRWIAKTTRFGKPVFLGYFNTQTKAATAYNRFMFERFGAFARLNKV